MLKEKLSRSEEKEKSKKTHQCEFKGVDETK